MVNDIRHRKVLFFIAGILVFSMSLSSCDSLRQKFTRKKRKGEEVQTLVPVLEPEEYPSPGMDPEHNYKEHYDLIKAWYKDLWTAIDDKSTGKYIHYVITQVLNHIDQMKPLVDVPSQAYLTRLAGCLDYFNASIADSWQTRNVGRVRSDLFAFDRLLRDHLRADRLKGHFIKSMPAPASGSKP